MTAGTGQASRIDRPGGATLPRWLPLLALATAIGLCFGRTVGYGLLLWDDDANFADNPLLNPPSWEHLARFWTAPFAGLYVPVSYTLFTLETWISAWTAGGGMHAFDPRVLHGGTIVLHFLTACVVLRILRRLVAHDSAALAGALLFALHPIQTESVAWVTETRGTLAGFLGLLAVDRYVARASSDGSAGSWRGCAPATVLYVLALLSKPSAVAIPLVAAVVDRLLLGRPWKRVLPSVRR